MGSRGPQPKPTELKRRQGNPGKRPLPDPTNVVALPMAIGVPDPPADLLLEGQLLWARVWGVGVAWISPATDLDAVVQACRLADDLAVAREKWRATRDNGDGRMVVQMHDQLMRALGRIGFDPTSRAALGVAEVKVASTLDEIRRRNR